MRLNYDFFNRNTTEVAIDLLGCELVFNNHRGIIVETESYRGYDDPASHAYKGPSKRSKIMFGPAGFSYVYLIYGMYNCLNIVTEAEGMAGAVLIRGLKLFQPSEINFNGPGKLCKQFGITRDHNNINITQDPNFYISPKETIHAFKATSRIGITAGTDKLWRFVSMQ